MINFKDYIDQQYETFAEDDTKLNLDEKMYFDWKIRNGKRTKKWHTDRENYRIQVNKKTGQPKEVFITPSERLKRKVGQRKAAIKRRAKQRNITSKRKKSFTVRHNFGAKYNTRNHVAKKGQHGNVNSYLENDGIYPNMLETTLLCETPWVEVLPDIIWDYYSELNHSGWLMQLVSLCDDKEMVSLNDDTDSNNIEQHNKLQISDSQFKTVINNLLKDQMFIRAARYAYHNDMTEDDAEIFDATLSKYAPELLNRIK